MVMKSLELESYVIQPALPAPMSHSQMKRVYGNNDSAYYATIIAPGVYVDAMGHMYHSDPK
jgi:hypothetical protein